MVEWLRKRDDRQQMRPKAERRNHRPVAELKPGLRRHCRQVARIDAQAETDGVCVGDQALRGVRVRRVDADGIGCRWPLAVAPRHNKDGFSGISPPRYSLQLSSAAVSTESVPELQVPRSQGVASLPPQPVYSVSV